MIRCRGPIGKNQEAFIRRLQKGLLHKARQAQVSGRCPHCNGRGMKRHGYYERMLRFMGSNGPAGARLRVPRLLCPHCGHTHSVVSPGMVPYRWYALSFILGVLAKYLRRSRAQGPDTRTVTAICEKYGIAVSTLYRWLKVAFSQLKWLVCGIMATMNDLLNLAATLNRHLLDSVIEQWGQIYTENCRYLT